MDKQVEGVIFICAYIACLHSTTRTILARKDSTIDTEQLKGLCAEAAYDAVRSVKEAYPGLGDQC